MTDELGWRIFSDTPVSAGPMRQLTKLPEGVTIRIVLLDTGGPSQPRFELIIPDVPLPAAKPTRGFIGFDDGAGHAARYDPFTGVAYSIRPR